jgi:streptogramin lyase
MKAGTWLRLLGVGLAVLANLAAFGAALRAPQQALAAPVLTEFPQNTLYAVSGITTGPDGALWFTELNPGKIGRITPAGAITERVLPLDSSRPGGITTGPDGNLWFTSGPDKIARMTPDGNVTAFAPPTPGGTAQQIVAGPDGNLWFTRYGNNRAVGRITPQGVITDYTIPTAFGGAFGIAVGPDGNLWFTEVDREFIGRITPAGDITEFALPASSNATHIAAGPDGNLWFTDDGNNAIGRITTAGVATESPLPVANSGPEGIAAGPDGNLWFTQAQSRQVGRITPAGVLTEFALAGVAPLRDITAGLDGNLWFAGAGQIGRITTAGAITAYPGLVLDNPWRIANGPDGNRWFTERRGNAIGSVSPAGAVAEFAVPTAESEPAGVAAGPDGNLWFTEAKGNKIGRATVGGVITEFPIPTAASMPSSIVAGPDGNLWFTEEATQANKIGRITPAGVITEFPLPGFSSPHGITAGPDGNLWFAGGLDSIGRMTTAGDLTILTVQHAPNARSFPGQLTTGPDGNIWFTDIVSIGRVTPSGTFTDFPLPWDGQTLPSITTGPDGNLWFTTVPVISESSTTVGRITPSGAITRFTLLPFASDLGGIVTGPDGNLWVTNSSVGTVGRLSLGVPAPSACATPTTCQLHVTTLGPGVATPGSGVYAAGAVATLTAYPAAGQHFAGWRVDGTVAGLRNPLHLTMGQNRTVQAIFAADPPPSFGDLDPVAPATGAITRLATQGVIKGYGDGRFGPADPILRAQMAALITRAVGWEDQAGVSSFPDRCDPANPTNCVDDDLWRNVGVLQANGVARGYADGTYGPRDNLLSVQAVSVIVRALIVKGYWTLQADDTQIYPEVTAASGHRQDVVTFVHYAGALPGTASPTSGFPGWDQPATRAWFVQALDQALQSVVGADPVP